MPQTSDTINNQIFIGCPFQTTRPKYLRAIDELNKRYPLSYIVIGKERDHSAEDLLTVIKTKLLSSSAAIFDATGGNANVSLEFGFAEASEIRSALYVNVRKGHDRSAGAIISDLAGKRRKQYKTEKALLTLLKEFSEEHAYVKRFEAFFRREYRRSPKGEKRRFRALSLRIIHLLDDKPKMRRDDLVQELKAQDYAETEIERAVRALHHFDLLDVTQGRYSEVLIA